MTQDNHKNTSQDNLTQVKRDILAELKQRVEDKILEQNNYDLLEKLINKAENIAQAQAISALGTTYKKTGFHFDTRLEKTKGNAIHYLAKDSNLSFENSPKAMTHTLIIGDNYPALLNLLIAYREKIKVIYIDPPYGKDNLGDFAPTNYNNAITRDNLLSMLKPRLELAKMLLRDDGVIFCSIDDRNQAYLKCLFDDIFGERNFVACFIVQHNPRGRSLDRILAQTHEYLLCYAKDKSLAEPFWLNKTEKGINEYNRQDKKGIYREMRLMNGNRNFTRAERPNLYYPLYVNVKTNQVSTKQDANFTEKVLPINSFESEQCWTWSKNKVENENDLIIARKNTNNEWRIYRKDYLNEYSSLTKTKTLLIDKKFNNENGTEMIRDIFDNANVFSTPKPIDLIVHIVKISTTPHTTQTGGGGRFAQRGICA